MGDKKAPRFTKKPSLRQEGPSIVFNCEIEAAPEPKVTWYRGNVKLDDSNRLKANCSRVGKTDVYSLELVVKEVSPDDSGTYKVEAKNDHGQMSANINLNLQGMYEAVSRWIFRL